jgi:hypothetical protein
MSDSLDLLLMSGASRQPSMGRRAVAPVAVPPSPLSSRTSATAGRPMYDASPMASPSHQRKESSSASYGYAQPSPSSYGSASYGQAKASPSHSPSSYDKTNQYGYEKDGRSVQQYEQGNKYQQQHQQQPQQSLTSPSSSSSGGAVDWAAFKANKTARVGSAHATVSGASATAASAASSFVPSNGPKSAAAGLSDQYLAAAAAAQQLRQPQPHQSPAQSPQKKDVKTDDTVISGAVIAPLKSAQPQQAQLSTPVKRNPFASPPAGSPVAASPFATASSTLSRPGGLASSPTAAAAVIESGGGVRAVVTVPCPDCGRNFKRGSLMKHAKVCKKVFGAPSRAQFDSAKVRAQALGLDYEDGEEDDEDEGEERPRTAAYVRPTTAGVRKPLPGGKHEESKEQSSSDPKAPAKWKQSSEGLREAMRRAKKEKAVFAQSSALGIDMRSMMMKR